MKILLGQLCNNGDCLYATVLSKQIKNDFPNCHLTWAISRSCQDVIANNPTIDSVLIVDAERCKNQFVAWETFEREVLRKQGGQNCFDRIILSQIWPNNFRYYDGTVRPSILRSYGAPITVPIETDILLTEPEMQKCANFVAEHEIGNYEHRIIIECSSSSGQSYVTPKFALAVAKELVKRNKDTCVIISSHIPIRKKHRSIIDGSSLSIRETARLTCYCSLFVGCGSGLTVASTSTASKIIPNIQILAGRTSVYASFIHDFDYWGKDTSRFLELRDISVSKVVEVILACQVYGHIEARFRHGQTPEVHFGYYFSNLRRWMFRRARFLDSARSLLVTAERYGWREDLLEFGRSKIAPKVLKDPACILNENREEAIAFLDLIASK